MNYGKLMEFVGFVLIIGSFIYALYQDAVKDISFSENFGFDSLPFLLGMLIWSFGYMINPERKNKEEK